MFSGARYENPSELPCWSTCASCFRCEDKGKYAKCNRCSGRHDPEGRRDPHDIDDRCRCKEGVLQMRLKNGHLIVSPIPHDPFAGAVQQETQTQDEREWLQYLDSQREKMDDPNWDPIQFDDGSGGASEWADKQRGGTE